VLRFVFVLLILATSQAVAQETAQKPEPASDTSTESTPKASPAGEVSPEVAEAEGAIATADWSTAQARLTAWLAQHPADARALFDAGYVADAQSRLAEAEDLYRRAINADPHSFEAHLSLGLLLARQSKPEEARPELAMATHLDPSAAGPGVKARAWRALAQIDRATDRVEASADLLEALKISPETSADTLLAASLADDSGDYPAAETAYRRGIAIDPKSAPAIAGLAHVLAQQKRYPEAEAQLRAALELLPDDPGLTAELATVLAAQDKAEALPILQKLSAAHPDDPAISRMLAAVLAAAGDYQGSDRIYTTMLASKPNDATLLLGHGQNLIRMLRYTDAFVAFTRVTESEPGNADGWSGLAFAASRTNHPEVTVHALTMRSKFLPEVPSTYFLWATAYDSLHQKVQAATYYQHFLESSAGKFPDQEWQARQRLKLLKVNP